MGIKFINFGTRERSRRIIVPSEKANAKYEEIKKNLPKGGFISLNETYVSVSDTIEQGECVRYENI